MGPMPTPAQRRTHPCDGAHAHPSPAEESPGRWGSGQSKAAPQLGDSETEGGAPWTVALTPLGATLAHEGPWCPGLSGK